MSEHLLQIDATYFKYESEEEDLIELQLRNEDHVKVHYFKLIKESKYVRDKYKYSDAKNYIQQEIAELEEKYEISDESIKSFFHLIEEEKVNIRLESYRDIYTLCKYFNTIKFKKILDKIGKEELFLDLDFSIEILNASILAKSDNETELTAKIENYLSIHVNECIKNDRFGELPISTIFRIIQKSDIEKVDMTSLVDFIIESAATRFTLFKFVLLHKVESSKIDKLIEFIEEQNEDMKETYTGFIGPTLSFIKEMKSKNDKLLDSLKCAREEFDHANIEKEKMREELELIKEELNNSNKEKEEAKARLKEEEKEKDKMREELLFANKEKEEIRIELKEEIIQMNKKFDETKSENEQIKQELKQANEKLRGKENEEKQQVQTIIVGGDDNYNQLGEKSNNKNKYDDSIIFPPMILPLDSSSLLSYSVYSGHSVLVTKGGSLLGIGNNRNGGISSSLTKTEISQFTEFSIKDDSGHQLTPISAVCSLNGTLYMFLKSSGDGRQLIYCDYQINGGDPVFLDIGDEEPLSLFGGVCYSAAISVKGEVIFINRDVIKDSPNSRIAAVSIPGGEKASSVACLNDSVVVLSSNGRVFSSSIKSKSCVLKFSLVSELSEYEIVWVSGTREHCLAVSKEGRVFGHGSNKEGQLGLGEETKSVSSFTEISSLLGYEIRSAYAGYYHSLFETREGKILSCGSNRYGQLLLNSDPSKKLTFLPKETTIKGGATFYITGTCLSSVFVGCYPPPNTPNMRIQYHS